MVGGKTADVIISHFGTHLFLCISHYHKLGSLVSCTYCRSLSCDVVNIRSLLPRKQCLAVIRHTHIPSGHY